MQREFFVFPTSFAQQRLWFLDQYEPNSSVYNIPVALRLKGTLDIAALERSLTEIIRRHESLRTTFSMVEGEPVQVIAPSVEFSLAVLDLGNRPERERDEKVQQLANQEARRPFDLANGPLFRGQLLRLGEDDHVLLLTMHHIVSDGWSMGIHYRELSALYEAFSQGKPSPLPDLPIQYADFSVWQREWLQGEVLDRQLLYWRKQLAGIPAVLNLPTDYPRPAVQSYRGAWRSIELSKELTEGLKALSRKEGVTIFMTLLAAFQMLLYRYTGQDDIVVGSPIANRNRAEIEGLIGFFVNTLVLRSNFSDNPTFKELLARVRETALSAYAHQDLPFEKLVEELKPGRSLGHSPIFQVMFLLQNAPATSFDLRGIRTTPVTISAETAKFDLTLSMSDSGAGLRGSLQYSTDLFDDATIARMIGHWQTLLEGVAANANQQICQLPILSDAEKRQLLPDCNDTDKNYPKDKCIHELFKEQVEKYPEAVAVCSEDQRLTYRELNNRANQLAHYLQKLGVGPETLVGICVDRSVEMVVGLLGILKSGGAYVPLDPSYPKERLAFMLEDAQAKVLLTQERFLETVSNLATDVVCLDRDWSWIGQEQQENPGNNATPDNLAYIIYTSGTTGKPKGVMIGHRNVARLFRATEAWFDFGKDDVWTVFHSYGFDFSVWELWGALLYGGRAVIVPFWTSRSPEQFYELLCREQVTVLNHTPSAFRQLISPDQSATTRPDLVLRLIILGGEALDFQSLQPWFHHHGDQRPRVVNMYGITETTVHVTYRAINANDAKPGVGSLIGAPIPDLDLYILDKHRHLVPIGVPGELYIGGDGVARGYLNRPELTTERFVANPFSGGKTGKLYKTGDLGRRLANGDIEYLGRIDDQVKIRGFRIELGEIEATLQQHPAVKEAAVLAREEAADSKSATENRKSDRRLVAYIVSRQDVALSINELRSFVKEKLPDYMVPAAFLFVDGLPLTPNGKVDRKALPAPTYGTPKLELGYVAPRTLIEEMVSDIWAEVLKLDTLGIYDNFFDLGGHSLLATQAMSRICEAFKVEFSVRALFEGPTVAQLAKRIEESLGEQKSRSMALIVAAPRDRGLPLSFSQQRLWFLDQYEPNSSVYNIPSALRLKGSLDVGAFERSLSEIVRRHESLRTTFPTVHGEPVQVIAPYVRQSLAVVDLRDFAERDREEKAQQLANEEARRPFDLARGPLFRCQLLRLGEDDYVLLLTMHHIVSDGWSMTILFREIAILYEAYVKGEESTLAELRIQYADYAVWQKEWLKGGELERQLTYWKKQLDGIPAVLNLPTDRPRPAVQSYRGARQSIELSKELTEGLKALSRKEGVTLFMTLLAAFQTLLHRYTAQDDIVVGSPIANRNRTEIEGLIGFFVNTLVLRSNFSDNPTFKELLARVRETALGAYAHQDLPFEKLVEEIKPDRSLSHSPLFQAMFVLQNAPITSLKLEGLRGSRVQVGLEAAKFDLTLSMSETVDGLRGSLQYSTDLFDKATIARMIGHLQTLLGGIVANPDQRISQLPILSDAEKHQLLTNWNDTQRNYPRDKCIHELFEEQVEKTPDAVAVTFEDQRLTYRELNSRANQLAHYLQKLGVGPETTVGICMDRSLEIVVGLLGILKAGGAYVPLDPTYPKERLAFMLEDSHAMVLLTEDGLLRNFPEYSGQTVCLDGDSRSLTQQKAENPDREVTFQHIAYVIYTSGSTGVPKGTMIEHRSLVNYLCWINAGLFGAVVQNLPLITSLSFDASLKQLFAPLLNGKDVWILSGEAISQPALLLAELGTRIGVGLNCVPSLWKVILDHTQSGRIVPTAENFSFLFLGGEQISEELLDRTIDTLPDVAIWNLYGLTEATANSVFCSIVSGCARTIGRPTANTQIYILDSHLQPVPIGVSGEIHIGGDGLARAYLNRPELSAERFICNPFSAMPGARLYKTGDLARYLPDGNIELLGRIDDQVKIRGFRIELGEVESALFQHPGVKETVVLAREDILPDDIGNPKSEIQNPESEKRLVAYVVRANGESPKNGELRNFLRQKLPEYMVPSSFVFLDELPLTPNGKIDRKALPAPERRPQVENSYAAPRSPVEEIIAETWAEVLKLETIGVYDNFFDLGGHSLLATRAMSRLCHVFKTELPLRALFEGPTVAELAKRIEESLGEQKSRSMALIVAAPRDRGLPLSFSQQRLWFLDQYEPNSSVYNIPSALRLKGSLDVGAFERSLSEIVRRHESLRTTFPTVHGEPVQVIAPYVRQSLAVVDLRDFAERDREEKAQQLANEEARRPFDLARGPLFRCQLLRLGEDDYVLLLTMHHIVSDGWSMTILFREIAILYEAYVKGEESTLAELRIQYADYAVWQKEWLKGGELERQLTYWKKQLDGIPAVLNLPTDRPRPAVQSYRGARQSIELSKELTEGLKALSRKEGVTLFMTLLAAFQTLLHRYTAQDDIVVGSPIANRNRTEIEGLIGFFVNTLVLRSNFSDNPTFKELLARVREMALGAYAHQDLPFEKLVEEIRPERSVDRTPLFQVLFNMLNQEDARFDLPGLTCERISSSQAESKFDLTIYVREEKEQIGLNLLCRAALFSQAWMTCFLEQYKYLLNQIVGQPEKLIGSYSLVTPESLALLPDPSIALPSPPQQLVAGTVMSWAKQRPAQPAISHGQKTWSYDQLAQCADTLARRIVATGLAPGEVVAVHGQPSFGLIAAMIATFLSGGVLLPLDSNLPMQRKQRMLREAKAKRLLYVGALQPDDAWLEETFVAGVLFVDPQNGCAIETDSQKGLQRNELPEVHPDDPAYVFFTSGSSGVPKGVLGCHKGLSHFLSWQRETFAIGPGDRVAQLTALSFDAVLRDIFLPLTSGATLCLPEDDALGSGEIIGWLERQQMTVLHAVPSLAQSWLVGQSATYRLGSMRWAFFMGEPLTGAFVRSWRCATGPAGEIVNFYGPTETTLIKCFYRVPDEIDPGIQPVGQPIPNTQALVLSGDKQLCGINEPGEIVLRTPFRTMGYVNAPEENQKRFVKNPFRDDPQDLIYFTGDAGCYRPDGSVQILGRRDDQVKIRGVRIDPDEVTATLGTHPLVHSCVVVGKKNDHGESYLAAYVTASGQEISTIAQLRSYLLAQLPAAMVPSVLVLLDALPLTPNGKIDRRALPEPNQRIRSDQGYIPPRTDMETVIAGIWRHVLKLEKIGVYDNFFDLGGHSLMATQIVSRLREALRAEISLRVLFEKPTVAGLSEHIKMIRQTRDASKVIDKLDEIEEITL